jgi:hypothetical protein
VSEVHGVAGPKTRATEWAIARHYRTSRPQIVVTKHRLGERVHRRWRSNAAAPSSYRIDAR